MYQGLAYCCECTKVLFIVVSVCTKVFDFAKNMIWCDEQFTRTRNNSEITSVKFKEVKICTSEREKKRGWNFLSLSYQLMSVIKIKCMFVCVHV